MWYKLAARLGLPLQECMKKTTSSEFVEWMHFFKKEQEEEIENPSKQDWYLAQIAAEVCNVLRKKRVDVKKFLLKFKSNKKTSREFDQISAKERSQRSRQVWMAVTGASSSFQTRLPPGVTPQQVEEAKKKRTRKVMTRKGT